MSRRSICQKLNESDRLVKFEMEEPVSFRTFVKFIEENLGKLR